MAKGKHEKAYYPKEIQKQNKKETLQTIQPRRLSKNKKNRLAYKATRHVFTVIFIVGSTR